MLTTRARGAARALARGPCRTARAQLSSAAPFAAPGFFELRTDHVTPGAMGKYVAHAKQTASDRLERFPGWLGMWRTELGGSVHTVRQLYHWNDYDQRDAARALAARDPPKIGRAHV